MRRLQAIEIAEGALLADIAVVFHLIAVFLPVGSSFFQLLCFVAFAVLVLRRGLYVGMMGLVVGMFIVAVVIGPHSLFPMLLEGAGGLYLGLTMKRRFSHVAIIVLGALGGALFLYCWLFLLTLFFHLSLQSFFDSIHQAEEALFPVLASSYERMGQGEMWRQTIHPQLVAASNWLITYWWLSLYLALLTILLPVVVCVYVATNTLVRWLGYEVRPFPNDRFIHRLRWLFQRLIPRKMIKKVRSRF
ncbi:DUF2232 domain-containing protein [Tengunoibacter tsumagoiensis]|uniref:DUF2232 domain-containing protein n=1 Tax=Tengunoibacter tsumagoiensis TaxID=2014871 RepID=A0A402A1I0_9CHLR|nr:DUF2232 domain-containing protein [Tengunoibacter tsumagoiensis]GCE12993.1 hypothetical protein KTT_28520 [Tengunoibacter tsumagoiensis]